MARTVSKVILVGNVGRDPQDESTQGGPTRTIISLATHRRTGADDHGEPEERTDWHRLVLKGRVAEMALDYVERGDRIYVEGRLEYDSYERDGVAIPTTEIAVRELVLLWKDGKVEV